MSAVETETLGADEAKAESELPTPASLAESQTPVTPDEPRTETERVEPTPTGPVTLLSGTQVNIVPLKLRETMKLLRIVTRGAGSVLEGLINEMDLNDADAFGQTLAALILMSIPEAENEAVDFIQVMVEPVGFDQMNNNEKVESLQKLAQELSNPELDDTVTIIERIVRRESEDIRNLGKRISTAFKMARRVGIVPAENK